MNDLYEKNELTKTMYYIDVDNNSKIALHHIANSSNLDKKERKAIILCHGITYSSLAVFDIPIEGFSFAERLANSGYDVFMPDYLGYGKSIYEKSVVVDVASAGRDLDLSLKFIRDLEKYSNLYLVGWSWGAQVAGKYAMEGEVRVDKLVLYGFKWHVKTEGLPEIRGDWRKNDINHLKADFAEPSTIIPEVLEEYFKRALELDPESSNGPRKEVLKRNYFLEPEHIKIPTLIVHGHKDPGLDVNDSIEFYARLKCIKYYSIIYGAHPIHMEINYWQLIEIMRNFLDKNQ